MEQNIKVDENKVNNLESNSKSCGRRRVFKGLSICFMGLLVGWGVLATTYSLDSYREKIEHIDDIEYKEVQQNKEIKAGVENDWRLTLVNPWNEMPEDYVINSVQLMNGQSIDEGAYEDLQQMMDDCRGEGLSPIICSSYRTMQKQQSLFNNQVNGYINQGYSVEEAKIKAGEWVAVPGTSEHQLGLAVDIVAQSNQRLNESQEKTAEQQWLMKNCHKYGFILRYPLGKKKITGINYEPWHYRYVGKEAATEIMEKGISLEEYLLEMN